MSHFPDSPSFTGFKTPSRIEADIADLVHHGTIPPALNGAFGRVQPDPQFSPQLGDDMASKGEDFAAITCLTATAAECPRIDDRFAGRQSRQGWMLEMDFKRPIELPGGSAGGAPMN